MFVCLRVYHFWTIPGITFLAILNACTLYLDRQFIIAISNVWTFFLPSLLNCNTEFYEIWKRPKWYRKFLNWFFKSMQWTNGATYIGGTVIYDCKNVIWIKLLIYNFFSQDWRQNIPGFNVSKIYLLS